MTSEIKPIPEEQDQYIYRSIHGLASGVSFLHTAQEGTFTSHHDLKPANILIIDGRFQISDFDRSHLRQITQGSATQKGKAIGTPEYQPPEYWSEDGIRAEISHGRAFDVWALGCIIIELATLVVYGWNPMVVNGSTNQPVLAFRAERFKNQGRITLSMDGPQSQDNSFWNNYIVVEKWVEKLKSDKKDTKLMNILNTALEMTVSDPKDRMYMWEAELDLYENLQETRAPHNNSDTVLKVKPQAPCFDHTGYYPIDAGQSKCTGSWKLSVVPNHISTPLHRAANSGNRKRVVQLWSLGWPIFVADSKGRTPLAIMETSDNSELRNLEGNVTKLLEAAKNGDIKTIRDLFKKQNLHPGMADKDGRLALNVAIEYGQADVVRLLLEYDPENQLSRWTWNDSCFRKIEGNIIELLEAVKKDDANKINDLIYKHRLNVRLKYINGCSPSDIANQYQCFNASQEINYLKDRRIDSDGEDFLWEWWKDTYDERPLHTAARFGFVKGLEELFNHEQEEMINVPCREWDLFFNKDEQLWQTKQDHDYRDCTDHRTPLFLAAQHGKHEAVELLLKHGARSFPPVPQKDNRIPFKTALAAAIDSGDKKTLELILCRAPDAARCLEHQDQFGQRPLLQAISQGNIVGFELLL